MQREWVAGGGEDMTSSQAMGGARGEGVEPDLGMELLRWGVAGRFNA